MGQSHRIREKVRETETFALSQNLEPNKPVAGGVDTMKHLSPLFVSLRSFVFSVNICFPEPRLAQ